MAIQPIDLQILFSQMDKVGKIQADQKDGAQIQQSLQGAANQKKVDERVRSVIETPDTGYGAERVKDKQKRRGDRAAAGEKEDERRKDGEEDESAEEGSEVVKDPDLGRNIDISG